jgi:2-polyprenyl-3-methyl-5-hydroxy-6-metoxy-1,4-benzoquinol methylase
MSPVVRTVLKTVFKTRPSSLPEIGPAIAEILRALSVLAEKDPALFEKSSRRQNGEGAVSRTPDLAVLLRRWEQRREEYFVELQSRVCPSCGSADHDPLFLSQDGYPYVRCNACAMWYVQRYLPNEVWARYQREEADVAALHDRQFALSVTEERQAAEQLRFGGYFEAIRPFCPQARLDVLSYLDVGCYTGNSLRVASSRGMRAYGIDGSRRVVEYVRRERTDLSIYSSLSELRRAAAGPRFDLVSFWEALEHEPEPLAVLRECRDLLRPGGLLALTVPNAHSTLPLVLRDYCFYCFGGMDLQGHINLFSPDTLASTLQAAGFEMLTLESLYSTNWEQVLFYLSGQWEKIYCLKNLRSGSCQEFDAPTWSESFTNDIGPDLSRLEKTLRFGPMIFAIARAA